jgi:hypothetical protein
MLNILRFPYVSYAFPAGLSRKENGFTAGFATIGKEGAYGRNDRSGGDFFFV